MELEYFCIHPATERQRQRERERERERGQRERDSGTGKLAETEKTGRLKFISRRYRHLYESSQSAIAAVLVLLIKRRLMMKEGVSI